jgi:hypothetical protein
MLTILKGKFQRKVCWFVSEIAETTSISKVSFLHRRDNGCVKNYSGKALISISSLMDKSVASSLRLEEPVLKYICAQTMC